MTVRSPVGTFTTHQLVSGSGIITRELVDRLGMSDATVPTVSVTEDFPANPDVVLSPGQSVQPQVTAGRIVELEPGSYGNQTIAPASGVHLFCRTPYGAVFTASNPNTTRWCESGGNDVTLQGIKIDRYGPNGFEGDPAFRFPSGSSGWRLIDFEVQRALSAGVGFRGSNHELIRPKIHQCGRYAWHGGNDSVIRDGHFHDIATGEGVEFTGTFGDHGVTKMAGGSSGMLIVGGLMEDINGNGIWWDGARDGVVRGMVARRVNRQAFNVEVSWGGAQNAPPGKTTTWPDPAFEIDSCEAYENPGAGGGFWPDQGAYAISISPGVWVHDCYAEDIVDGLCGNWNDTHSVFDVGFPAQGISASWAQANLSLDDVLFENNHIEDMGRYYAAWTDSLGGPPVWTGNTYVGSSLRFRWEFSNFLTLAQWQALGNQ